MELLHTAALLLLQRCAPTVATATMASVVQQESSWHPYAIADATANRRFYPATYERAAALANTLLTRHHNIAVGYAGIYSANFASYGLDARSALDPCVNLAVGADILNTFYFGRLHNVVASDRFSEACSDTLQRDKTGTLLCRSGGALDLYGRRFALSASLQAYNTGSYVGAPQYAFDVISRAKQIVVVLPPPPDLSIQTSAAPPRGASLHSTQSTRTRTHKPLRGTPR